VRALLPALAGARESGRTVRCLSNLRQLGIACMTYTNDYQGFWPAARRDPKAGPNFQWYAPAGQGMWYVMIDEYLNYEQKNGTSLPRQY